MKHLLKLLVVFALLLGVSYNEKAVHAASASSATVNTIKVSY
ncbi:hypothetical protein P4361_00410 [Fictibacillus sp. B-59209]|nr:hypothetical protein [Fictibacillus sp. B-59209]